MPILSDRQVNEHTRLGIWKITEMPDDLLGMLNPGNRELQNYQAFRHEERKKQWLSYRLLVKLLLGDTVGYAVSYDTFGKPFIEGSEYQLSVSHSGEYSVVILSWRKRVGIDIEKMRPAIETLAARFLSPGEMDGLDPGKKIQQLHAFWCAKEAIYKAWGRRGLDFARHIRVEPERLLFDKQGSGHVNKDGLLLRFLLEFEEMDGYMMSYAIECQ
jgi:phosphopantetheine--protein transferase-like protein